MSAAPAMISFVKPKEWEGRKWRLPPASENSSLGSPGWQLNLPQSLEIFTAVTREVVTIRVAE